MKVFTINAVPYGSTCNVMCGVNKELRKNGNQVSAYTGYSFHPIDSFKAENITIGGKFTKIFHMFFSRLTGIDGVCSFFTTLSVIKKLKKEQVEIIHLHNLHGWFINLPMLFRFIKKHNIRVIWTLHDCWSFTGHCSHFDMIGCDKWRKKCKNCPQYKEYPKSLFDNSKSMFRLKKKWFTGVKDLTIITPSQWLADLVKQSYLGCYPVKVINNGINLSIFKPTPSAFREKYDCKDKYIILGVAFGWGAKKGFDVFVELSKRLDNKYQIVLVGTDENVDKQLPDNIISIHRTQNQQELAEIYTAADLFVNPTREENFPTVNIESLACGTPVLTFKTGGSPEIIDETCGIYVTKNDIDALEKTIKQISAENPFTQEACVKRASNFNANKKFEEYVELYV